MIIGYCSSHGPREAEEYVDYLKWLNVRFREQLVSSHRSFLPFTAYLPRVLSNIGQVIGITHPNFQMRKPTWLRQSSMQALLSQLKKDPKLTPQTTCQQPLNSSSKHFLMYQAASFRQAISFFTICTQMYSVICSAYSFIYTRMSQNFTSVEICIAGGTQSFGMPARDCFYYYTFYLISFYFVAIKDNLKYVSNQTVTSYNPVKPFFIIFIGETLGRGRVGGQGRVCFWGCSYKRQLSCMRPRHLHRNQFVSLGDITLQQLAALDVRHKQSSTFVTQKTIAYEDEIHQHHFELIRYLDNLGDKVAGVIEHNEAEIFTAYKKHFARVKKELEEFKKHSEAQANSSNTYLEKIDCLEKQLVVFREESLKLFSRVTEKDKTIEHLKLTLEELLSEKRHMDGLIKQLSRRNRELETQKDKYERKHSETDNITLQINSFSKNFVPSNRLRDRPAAQTVRPASNMSKPQRSVANHTIAIDLSFHEFAEADAIVRRLKQRLPSLDDKAITGIKQVVAQCLSEEQRKRNHFVRTAHLQKQRDRYDQNQTKLTNRSRSIYTADLDAHGRSIDLPDPPTAKDSLKQKTMEFTNSLELCQYFKKCIETVRKEIGVRRKVNTVSFYREGTPIGIEQFKKIDFIRLMELVCSHESVILALYNSLIEAGK